MVKKLVVGGSAMLFMMTDNCAGDGGWSCHDDKALRVGGEGGVGKEEKHQTMWMKKQAGVGRVFG